MIELHEHPYYADLSEKWIKYRDLYQGEHKVLKSINYLWLHELEGDGSSIGKDGQRLRKIRELRSRYLNLMEPIVSRWLSSIFRKPALVPDSVKKMFGKLEYNNVSGDKLSFETFIRERIGKNYVLYGRPIVLVDTSAVHAATIAEAKQKGLRPFMEILDPLEVVDWTYSDKADQVGQLSGLRTEYKLIEPRANILDKPVMATYSRVFSLKDGAYAQQLYKQKSATDLKSGKWELQSDIKISSINKLPISLIDSDSFISDASEMQLLVFNLMSAESSALNSQAFQRIFVSGNMSEKAKIFFNEYMVNFLPEGANVQIVEPYNSAPLSEAVLRAIDWTFKVAFNQVNGLSGDSKESPSAETRKELKDEFIAIIQTAITELEDIINESVNNYALMKGEGEQERVKLDKNISSDDIERELAIWQAHADDFKQITSLRSAVLKKHVKSFGLHEEEQILNDIDNTKLQSVNTQDATQSRSDILRGIASGGK